MITSPRLSLTCHLLQPSGRRAINSGWGSTAVLPRAACRRVSSGYAKSDGAFLDLMQQAMEHFRMRAEK